MKTLLISYQFRQKHVKSDVVAVRKRDDIINRLQEPWDLIVIDDGTYIEDIFEGILKMEPKPKVTIQPHHNPLHALKCMTLFGYTEYNQDFLIPNLVMTLEVPQDWD